MPFPHFLCGFAHYVHCEVVTTLHLPKSGLMFWTLSEYREVREKINSSMLLNEGLGRDLSLQLLGRWMLSNLYSAQRMCSVDFLGNINNKQFENFMILS